MKALKTVPSIVRLACALATAAGIFDSMADDGYGPYGAQHAPSSYRASADLVPGGAFIDRILDHQQLEVLTDRAFSIDEPNRTNHTYCHRVDFQPGDWRMGGGAASEPEFQPRLARSQPEHGKAGSEGRVAGSDYGHQGRGFVRTGGGGRRWGVSRSCSRNPYSLTS